MLRRTLFALAVTGVAIRKRLRGQNRNELQAMTDRQLASTPHKSDEIMKLDSAGARRILEDPDSSDFAKAKACQRLAMVGDESSVPALASLLGHPKLAHYARTALEPMPGAAVDRALREAVGKVEGSLLVGVVNSIGVRRDPAAIKVLAPLRYREDADVAAAATSAISRIRRP